MSKDGKVVYVELPSSDMSRTQGFYHDVFGWSFVDYGPSYASFSEGMDGGFDADAAERPSAPLVVIQADDLEATLARVQGAGAAIVKPIFSFPGGRRFHFKDASGNELAVMQPD